MKLKGRLEKLEQSTPLEVTKLWTAVEDDHTPGLYHLDDGRTPLTEAELDALPGKGSGCHGFIIRSPYHRDHHEA